MIAVPGYLDNLVGASFEWIQYDALTIQSVVGGSSGSEPSAISIQTTSASGVAVGDTLTVSAVNDTADTVTFSNASTGSSFTDYVIGYSTATTGYTTNSYLVSSEPASQVDPLLNQSQFSAANSLLDVLSTGLLPPGTDATYAPTSTAGLTITDTANGFPVMLPPQVYVGPVAGLRSQFIDISADSLNITAATPGWFIHSGGGEDAIAVSSGTNVLDGGTGSNFLTGGSGTDTFFVDDRTPTVDIWSTVANFHSGDAATIWGVTPSDFTLSWVNGQGATGYTGLTLSATSAGKPDANLTLVGYTSADLANGKLVVTFGTTPTTDGIAGSTYMYVHAT